ncbi:MAG: GNAT family N-acetyltransferase [Bacillota bacterium]
MLRGEKVNLRAIELTDLDNVMAWINDPEVTRHLLVGLWPLSRGAEAQWIERRAKDADPTDKALVIETKDGVYLGGIGLHRIDFASGTAEAGIVIGRKDYWGKGYGTDALRVLLKHAFENLRLRKVYLSVFGSNMRAQKSYAKLGFREVGRLKAHTLKQGQYEDVIYMEVFREEFEQACAAK